MFTATQEQTGEPTLQSRLLNIGKVRFSHTQKGAESIEVTRMHFTTREVGRRRRTSLLTRGTTMAHRPYMTMACSAGL
jgi:hypothetical protein